MKTLKYDLLSFPGESVNLPKEAVNIGNDFIGKIKKSKNKNDLSKRINEHTALRFIAEDQGSLLRRANYIMSAKAESARKKSFIDYIYLDLGEYYSSGENGAINSPKIMKEITSFSSELYKKYH